MGRVPGGPREFGLPISRQWECLPILLRIRLVSVSRFRRSKLTVLRCDGLRDVLRASGKVGDAWHND